MNKLKYLILIFLIISCKKPIDKALDSDASLQEEILNTTTKPNQKTKNVSANLMVDHFNIWVENHKNTKEKLKAIGFTAVPDSLSAVHKGQGTAGRYFRFLNSYLELIFVNDKNELIQNNKKNKNLDFTERANFKENGASPFSVGLKLVEYNVNQIPFNTIRYHQDWMDKKEAVYAAENSKKHLEEPSVFVVYPELEADSFDSLSDLNKIPKKYAIWREFYKHPNGAQKITNIVITTTETNMDTKTLKALNGIESLTVKNGKFHIMELYFDNNNQKKTFDLRPELPLIIHL